MIWDSYAFQYLTGITQRYKRKRFANGVEQVVYSGIEKLSIQPTGGEGFRGAAGVGQRLRRLPVFQPQSAEEGLFGLLVCRYRLISLFIGLLHHFYALLFESI